MDETVAGEFAAAPRAKRNDIVEVSIAGEWIPARVDFFTESLNKYRVVLFTDGKTMDISKHFVRAVDEERMLEIIAKMLASDPMAIGSQENNKQVAPQNDHIQCPFDKNHWIPRGGFQKHLIDCRVRYYDESRHATCYFNYQHILPKDQFEQHLHECADRPLDMAIVNDGSGPVAVPRANRDVAVDQEERYKYFQDVGAGRVKVPDRVLPVPEYECVECSKKYSNYVAWKQHNFQKHQGSVISAPRPVSAKAPHMSNGREIGPNDLASWESSANGSLSGKYSDADDQQHMSLRERMALKKQQQEATAPGDQKPLSLRERKLAQKTQEEDDTAASSPSSATGASLRERMAAKKKEEEAQKAAAAAAAQAKKKQQQIYLIGAQGSSSSGEEDGEEEEDVEEEEEGEEGCEIDGAPRVKSLLPTFYLKPEKKPASYTPNPVLPLPRHRNAECPYWLYVRRMPPETTSQIVQEWLLRAGVIPTRVVLAPLLDPAEDVSLFVGVDSTQACYRVVLLNKSRCGDNSVLVNEVTYEFVNKEMSRANAAYLEVFGDAANDEVGTSNAKPAPILLHPVRRPQQQQQQPLQYFPLLLAPAPRFYSVSPLFVPEVAPAPLASTPTGPSKKKQLAIHDPSNPDKLVDISASSVSASLSPSSSSSSSVSSSSEASSPQANRKGKKPLVIQDPADPERPVVIAAAPVVAVIQPKKTLVIEVEPAAARPDERPVEQPVEQPAKSVPVKTVVKIKAKVIAAKGEAEAAKMVEPAKTPTKTKTVIKSTVVISPQKPEPVTAVETAVTPVAVAATSPRVLPLSVATPVKAAVVTEAAGQKLTPDRIPIPPPATRTPKTPEIKLSEPIKFAAELDAITTTPSTPQKSVASTPRATTVTAPSTAPSTPTPTKVTTVVRLKLPATPAKQEVA